MAKTDFVPRREGDFPTLHDNFKAQLATLGARLGVGAEKHDRCAAFDTLSPQRHGGTKQGAIENRARVVSPCRCGKRPDALVQPQNVVIAWLKAGFDGMEIRTKRHSDTRKR